MAKTRSQTKNVAVKKEEENSKPTLWLGKGTTTPRNKITTRKPSKNKNRLLPVQQVKVEEDTDTKSLLQSTPKSSKLPKGQRISQEQINQLIDYTVNHNMSIIKASRKVNISHSTGLGYYNLYINDPEKKIPVPRDQIQRTYTQEHMENLIRYINNDKMTIKDASTKANMSYDSGKYYYNKYLKDPNHNIPIPKLHQIYTQDQKNKFIDYIVRDKMSILAASKKVKMSITTARKYYHRYFKIQNPDIARPSHIATPICYTQEQIKKLINYIVDDRMSISAASRKVSMRWRAARRHYQQYLNDTNMEVPGKRVAIRYTQDQKNEFINYVFDDKMPIKVASRKANINRTSSYHYYYKYIKNHNPDAPIPKTITQEQKGN